MHTSLLLLSTLVSSAVLAAKRPPRGVAPEQAALYPLKGTFQCLKSSNKIPASAINNNFCDCPDGSDEPGTPACAGVPLAELAIPGFYCENKGYRSLYIPLNRVDDGACDCCDGSDEPKGVCANTCKTEGDAWRKEKKVWEETVAGGLAARQKLVEKAQAKKAELEKDALNLVRELDASKAKIVLLEAEVKKAEEEDKLRTVRTGPLSVPLQLLKDKSQDVRDALRKAIEERNALREKVARLENVMKALSEGYNPNFNDDAVKAAIKSWDDYAAQMNDLAAVDTSDIENYLETDKEEEELYNELNAPNPTAEDLGKLWALTSYFPPSVQSTLNNLLLSARTFLVDNGILAGHRTDSSHGDSPRLAASKEALNVEKGVKSGIEARISQLEKDKTANYGPDDVFLAIKGECLSQDVAGYKYTMCFSGKATQKSLKDGSEVSLGEWEGVHVLSAATIEKTRKKTLGVFGELLEDRRVDGTGEIRLLYENGQQCWNGPRRSVNVELVCAKANELREVRETQKCVYEMIVGSPVVCRREAEKGEEKKVKDEL